MIHFREWRNVKFSVSGITRFISSWNLKNLIVRIMISMLDAGVNFSQKSESSDFTVSSN